MSRLFKILLLAFALSVVMTTESKAQHTIAITGGTGFATARPYPAEQMKIIWGTYQVGFSWRYYSLPRMLACFGIDVELLQRGFSFAPFAYYYKDKKDYKYYTRTINSIVIPLVWQPHIYLFKKHLRVYIEAAPTFSFNFASKFRNEETLVPAGYKPMPGPVSGKYEFRTERDNIISYGLRAGGGFDLLFGQVEVGLRVVYDLGFSDILRNRTKYYSNNLDHENKPGENPFYLTPLRSPLDNLTFSVKIGFRIGKAGFKEWDWKRPNVPKYKEVFNYTK